MSQGFPGRSSYDDLGGTRENAMPITDPRKQIDFAVWNAVQWQLAGLNKLGPLVSLTIDDDGTKLAGGEAWNTEDVPARRVTINHSGTGVYVIAAQAASYTDWRGDDGPLLPVVFTGALISPQSASSVRPPTYTLDSATQITVRTWNAAGSATDMPFTVSIL
jgi:hypothetical protein